mmetsp:Transcript_17677/g.15591  ORF Transcript_17677/g.15591 Transcript_17677/m.15591 type:complete len:207 (+) Transcript_17677:416-1036(+)
MGALNQFMVTFGIMIAYFLGFTAPVKYVQFKGESLNPQILTTQSWRIVFIVPAILAIIQSLLLIFIFKYDTPKYYKQQGRRDMIKTVNKAIYTRSELDESIEEEDIHEEYVPISKLLEPQYIKAFIAGCILALFIQLSGINSIIFYSSTIFTKGSEPGYDTEVSARIGTAIVGIVNCLVPLLVIPLLSKMGRKSLLSLGHIGMIIS